MYFRFTLTCLALFAWASVARAQTPAAGANAGQSRDITQSATLGPALAPGLHETFSVGTRWQPDEEWDTGGRARVARENVAGGLLYIQSPTLQYGVVADHEISRYEFDGPAVDPTWIAAPGEMRVERVTANLRRPLDNAWSLFAAVDANWSLARGANYADAFTWGGMVSARDQVTTNFAFTLGLFAHTRLEAGARVLPIPGIEWQINPDWKLATAQGLTLTRKLNRHWQADFALLVENREYRMPAEQPFEGGIFRDRSVPLVTSLRWSPNPAFFAQVSAGVSLWQEQRLTDRADAPDLTEQSHWSPSLALAAGVRF